MAANPKSHSEVYHTTTLPPSFTDPSQNPSSPFHIHPSESPISVIVTPALNGNNYQSWFKSIRMALITKNKMGFLNGSISIPENTSPLFPHWERCNNLLTSWLLNSVSPSIAQSIVFFDNATDIWNDLRERFSRGDLLRVAELQEEIYSLKQGTATVTDYYTSLKALWEELDNFRPFTPCSCSALTFHKQDFIIRFLKGLDERFAMVRSQILLLDPLPSSNRVFSMIIQHERQHHSSSPASIDVNPFVNATSSKPCSGSLSGRSKFNTSNRKCDHCGRQGHTSDICYQKPGNNVPKCEHCT